MQLLERRMLSPYLITNSTILNFQNHPDHSLLSFIDLLELLSGQTTKSEIKLCFRLQRSDDLQNGQQNQNKLGDQRLAYIEVTISKLRLKVCNCEEQFMIVMVNPISNMIQNQQRISDEMY